ncbi:hypothetical protein [Spiroplasma endosymbiont of Aspidapion aeneum]|uniref:hypothetical protein n=1 Tax=Spiroplasma endosymbiont of Aspidapion aeneum TaxID=3066276 RepID=UPI00313ACE5C
MLDKKDKIIEKDDHEVIHDDNEHKKDHYHEIHHFDKYGGHDDVNEDDFDFKLTLKHSSKKNLIYRISLTGTFLALAVVCTALDELTEAVFAIPTPAGMISLRFLDITIVTISIALIGPVYAGGIGLVIPIIHWSIHQEHAIYNSLLECVAYCALIWYFWFLYYVIFRNSMIHKDVDKKRNLYKRFIPSIPYVLVGAAMFAILAVIGLWLTYLTATTHNNGADKDDNDADFANITSFKVGFVVFLIFFGFECLRLSITYTLFQLLDGPIKKINHRYR